MYNRNYFYSSLKNKGLTLVELMVAIALSLFVVGLGIFAMMGASVSLQTVSSTSSTTDSSMLLTTVMQRAIKQAGFQPIDNDDPTADDTKFTREAYYEQFKSDYPTKPYPDIYGKTNLTMNSSSAGKSLPTAAQINSFYTSTGSGALATSAGPSNSDILALRFQAIPETLEKNTGGITAMLNLCTGDAITANPYSTTYSTDDTKAETYKPLFIFSVDTSEDEGVRGNVLYCDYYLESAAKEDGTKQSLFSRHAIMDGIVVFKVLYGVSSSGMNSKGAPDTWKDAKSMTTANWRQIKRVRIGFVLRSTAQNAGGLGDGSELKLYPLGKQFYVSSNPGTEIVKPYESTVVYREVNFTVDVSNRLIPNNFE